jgi:predicted DNA-binding protein (UPF0251 family)
MKAFKPTGFSMCDLEKVTIRKDELEALKLCDKDGLTQSEAGQKMNISRITVQRILASARGKMASAVSDCKALILEDHSSIFQNASRDKK